MQEQFTINLQAAQYRQREGESILDALLRGGESLEYQCKQGYCGACAGSRSDDSRGEDQRLYASRYYGVGHGGRA